MKNRSHTAAIIYQILESGHLDLCLTDKETVFKINELLTPDQHISYATYQRFKAQAMKFCTEDPELQDRFEPIYQDLYNALLDHNIRQKENFVEKMLNAPGNEWLKYRWLLQNKFPDFNMKMQTKKFLSELALKTAILKADMDTLLGENETAKPPMKLKAINQRVASS